MTSALERAIEILGSQSALARTIGLTPQGVSWWVTKAIPVPAEYVLPIERATEGKVTRHELRPDLYPAGRDAAADLWAAAPTQDPARPRG